jgi:hypothetical protein
VPSAILVRAAPHVIIAGPLILFCALPQRQIRWHAPRRSHPDPEAIHHAYQTCADNLLGCAPAAGYDDPTRAATVRSSA